ncbi:hypothetical protein GCM10022198_06010 [Klugiella xanthotipulae]|uniref:hypothetical protein n=1 Tax=Klugiella xanthotipulae TaxID=244735 RepID=UPI001152C8B7|nr:hypothetical protein [Klugiella xanthotipulae]
MIESGHSTIFVIGMGVLTCITHLVTDIFSHQIRGDSNAESRPSLSAEIRDAGPIASCASFPAAMMLIAWIGWGISSLAGLKIAPTHS